MGMSDCSVCWETPCSCGNEYKNWTVDRIKSQIEMLTNVLKEKEAKSNETNEKKTSGFPLNESLKKELQSKYDELIKSLNDGTFSVDTSELARLGHQLGNCNDKEFLATLSDISKKAGLRKPE